MNLFVIMMLLNMALVWLMIYFSICLMIIVLKWYFEITFIPLKKDCADRPFESTSISSLGQHNRWKIFYDSRFEMIYDFHFEMSNAFLFSFWNALWLSFRNEGAKFSYTKLFSSGEPRIFYWRKYPIIYIFRTQLFYARLSPYPCV